MSEDICSEYGVNAEQAEALDINKNIALRAGAGSGKTRVLTRRYLRLLVEVPGISLDSIVAITFTKKAAAEMKERIRQEFASRVGKAIEPNERKKWEKFRISIVSSNIDTIHGFCAKLLRDNFEVLGLDPFFSIMDEVDSSTKLRSIAGEVIEEYLDNPTNDEICDCVLSEYSSAVFTSAAMIDGVTSLYNSIRQKGVSVDEVEYIMREKTAESREEGRDKGLVKAVEQMALELVRMIHDNYELYKYKENLIDFNDLEILTDKLLEDETVRNKYMRRYKYFLVDEFQDVNQLQKRILDKLVLSNGHIQPGRLFIVGDHKQSIYGFRGTDYRIFENACEFMKDNGEVRNLARCYRSTNSIIHTVNTVFGRLIEPFEPLDFPEDKIADNQLSKKGHDVKLITWQKDKIGDKSKQRWDKIRKLLPDDYMADELREALNLDHESSETMSKHDYQGEIIAGEIFKLNEAGFALKDIAILLQSRSGLRAIENSLSNSGIPYCVLGGIGFWGRQEIIDIIALYKLVFDLNDLTSLLTVLRSPIFAFSDDLIFKLKCSYGAKGRDDIIDVLEHLTEEVKEEKHVIIRAHDILQNVSGLGGIMSSYELLKYICRETSYPEILLSLPDGQHKFRNLEKLLSIVMNFDVKGYFNARELPTYLELLEDNFVMDSQAFLDAETSDAVKILTIHAAKGLEFDAVIIPHMDRSIDAKSKRDKPFFLFSIQNGITAIGINDKGVLDKDANQQYNEVYMNKLIRENHESRRLFYVAATRAKRFLAFIGEDQELKDEDNTMALNTFMKQLKWALMGTCSLDILDMVDGRTLIPEKRSTDEYPSAFIDKAFGKLKDMKQCNLETKALVDPIETKPKGNLSISMFMNYSDCPRSYYFSYIAGIKSLNNDEERVTEGELEGDKASSDVDAALRGNIAHSILEKLDFVSLEYEDPDAVFRRLETAMEKQYGKAFEAVKQDIDRYLKNLWEIERSLAQRKKGKLLKTLREFSYRVPLSDDISINGVIDRIDIVDNKGRQEAFIIDYKTNRISNEDEAWKKADYYKKQLYTYAMAVNGLPLLEGFKPVVQGCFLYFLDCAKYIEIRVTSEDMKQLKQEIIQSSEWLLGRRSFEGYFGNMGERCSWCAYKQICEKL